MKHTIITLIAGLTLGFLSGCDEPRACFGACFGVCPPPPPPNCGVPLKPPCQGTTPSTIKIKVPIEGPHP